MITALRKIEGRGELEGATSAVMELCVDNPREGFVDLFATHPPIDRRIKALVDFAGGHDPGPIALPPAPETQPQAAPEEPRADAPAPLPLPQAGAEAGKPFLPERPPLADRSADDPGPWGPHRGP
jgi:heat shock protein HtpX